MESPLKNLPFLKSIVELGAREFKKQIESSSKCQCIAVLLVVYNIYVGIVPINTKERAVLRRAKPFLKRLLSKQLGFKTKKNLLKSRSRLVQKFLRLFLSHE